MKQTRILVSALSSAIAVTLSAVRPGEDGTLTYSYDSLDAVPEAFRSLYSEGDDGKFELTGITGIKTEKDVNTVMGSLQKERNDHNATKQILSRLGRPVDEVLADLDRIPALEAAANGAPNIDEQLAGRLQQETAPLQRTIDSLQSTNEQLQQQAQQAQQELMSYKMDVVTSKFALKHKVRDDAIEDVQFMAQAYFEVNDSGDFVAKSNVNGVTPGIGIETWLVDLKQTKPYLFPESSIPNSRKKNGSGMNNPWAKDTFNMTEQSKLTKENPTLAAQLKAAAGK